jgi:preprotein translocase subunit SecG
MTTFVEIVYVLITVVMILVVLLQAGRGGGLGTALGGGASQGVFGGGGGADFLAKLTQGLAAGFMVCAVYLAYASAHTGSSRLQAESDETQLELFDEDEAVDYERIGEGTPLPLPEPGGAGVVLDPAGGDDAKAAAAEELSEAVEQFKQQDGEVDPAALDAAIKALEESSAKGGELPGGELPGGELPDPEAAPEAIEAEAPREPGLEASEAEAPTAEPVPEQPTK